jgi:hypothetical protein
MEKLRLFIAAAFMAALTGCPTPNPMPDSDTGTPPGDSGMPEVDSGTDPVDAGVDAYVPPGGRRRRRLGHGRRCLRRRRLRRLRVQPAVRHDLQPRRVHLRVVHQRRPVAERCSWRHAAWYGLPRGRRTVPRAASVRECEQRATDARRCNRRVHLRTGRSLLAELVQPGQQLLALSRQLHG